MKKYEACRVKGEVLIALSAISVSLISYQSLAKGFSPDLKLSLISNYEADG
ncbi:hypothetical protein LYNGBM3L_25790 [Moorena producens 3L]|uniref:Uncharacterized protein n=1 Tax=Moorena producens 3L TaxID=489825 RepID=F4XNT1_9CYAN|nr:hypothetical protein [Moorena sp. SIO4E2]EGJ33702.1 hypothetical protein LYNGBM3L_25790 [Moorena producens 3L]